jgi:hypothetical protein
MSTEQRTERQRHEHEIANLLSIALANVEAMVDGALGTTPERLENVCQALRDAREHLDKLQDEDKDESVL